MRLARGDSFDRYVIDVPLGEGGMGQVYRAYDRRLERHVALKILRVELMETDARARRDAIARLQREARAAAALANANAVSIFDVGDVDGVPYIAMELVSGQPLRAYVGAPGPPLATRVRWLSDVAQALGAAHAIGLVHRDVKPENVMLRDDGTIKVLDFGIARRTREAFEGEADMATVTATGIIVGTPLYMSPEQMRGQPLDGRADQFSWGVVAYELLAGRLPWDETKDGLQLVAQILTDDPPPASSVNPEIPAGVSAAVAKALAKSKEQRFATMQEVIAALEPYAQGSRSDGSPARPRRAGASEGAAMEAPPSPSPSPSPSPPPSVMTTVGRGRKLPARTAAAIVLATAALVGLWLASRGLGGGTAASPATSSAPASVARAAPSGAPTSILDLPRPETAKVDAAAAYLAGLQALRDASILAARRSFERAATIDPGLAAAHLRIAVWAPPSEVPARFQAARQARSSLTERDQLLLDALEAERIRQPPDMDAAARAMKTALDRFPADAELLVYAARFEQRRGRTREALRLLDRAIAVDAKLALAWWARGSDLEDLGVFEDAVGSYDRCLEVSHAAASCMRSRATIYALRGECERLEAEARSIVIAEPDGDSGHAILARALAARGRDPGAVKRALEDRRALLSSASRRSVQEKRDAVALAMLTGDFAAAEESALLLEKTEGIDDDDRDDVARTLVDLYTESGQPARAGRVADAYVKGVDGRVSLPWVGDHTSAGPLGRMLAASERAGLITHDERVRRREAWIASAVKSLPPAWAHEIWYFAYAADAETKDEAREAVDKLPSFEPLPPARDVALSDGYAGKALFLAGRPVEALPALRRGAASCLVLDFPVDHERTTLALGQALESAKDVDGACLAYRTIVDRWGAARPRSVTAERARERQRALACAR